jgi:hypothetical protein
MGIIVAFLIGGGALLAFKAWVGPTSVSRDQRLRPLDDAEFAALSDYKRRSWLMSMGYVIVVSLLPVPFFLVGRLALGPQAETVVNLIAFVALLSVPSVVRVLLGRPRMSFPPLSLEEEQRCRALFDNRFFNFKERFCPRCGEAVRYRWDRGPGLVVYAYKRCRVCGARVV